MPTRTTQTNCPRGKKMLRTSPISQLAPFRPRRTLSGTVEKRMIQILQNCKNIKQLKQTHLQILIHCLQSDIHILPKLINISSTFNSLDYGAQIFQQSKNPNIVAFNTLIKCFVDKNHQKEAFLTYNKLWSFGIFPNHFTFSSILKACGSLDYSYVTSRIHCHIVKCGYECNVFVQNTLLNAYSKLFDGLSLVRKLFDEMSERDVVTWNSMIGAYLFHNDLDQAMSIFEKMPKRNLVSWNILLSALCKVGDMASAQSLFDQMEKKDTISWNALIAGYVNCNDIATARLIFNQMKEKDVVSWTLIISGYTKVSDMQNARRIFEIMPSKNVISWNAMISGYNQNGQFDKALLIFQKLLMDGKFLPDEATLVSVISACAQMGSLEHGNWLYSYIKKNKVSISLPLGNALIDMFAKSGDMKNAELVFNKMNNRCIITWTTMISGLAFNGQCLEALDIFDRLCNENIKLDDVVFIAILSACSHGGFIKEGKMIFDMMVNRCKIKPGIKHYNCMVDLLGRAGKFEEAMNFIENMSIEPSVITWATLLAHCSVHGEKDLVKLLGQKILNIDPLNPSYRVLLSNLSALQGSWDGVKEIRNIMRREQIEKIPGCSSIQIGSEVHEFLVKDSKHKLRKEIYESLYGLTKCMKIVSMDDISFDIIEEPLSLSTKTF